MTVGRTSNLLAATLLLAIGLSGVMASRPAGAAPARPSSPQAPAQSSGEDSRVSVVQVSGLLDPVLAELIETKLDEAEREGYVALVLQVNSDGTVISDERVAELATRVERSPVPVAVWVGPSGSRAEAGMAQIAGVADKVGVAPGSRLGRIGEPVLDDDDYTPAFARILDRLRTGTIDAEEALELEIAATPASVIGQLVVDLEGVETRVVGEGEDRRREPVSIPRFSKLALMDQLMHTVSSPAVAYLLFVIGLSLIVFELYTAGVGVAGLVGAGALVLACYGLDTLPARGWAVGLLAFSMVAFAVDVQTGVPRVWTGVGVVALVVGSFALYERGLSLSWITLLVGIVGVALFMFAGMPAMVRTRFSTPTIGRQWMIGEVGDAVTDVNPDGVVRIKGAPWRARTNRATPIKAGEVVRVVEVEGLLLEVEPEEGGAIDYRERARAGADDDLDEVGPADPAPSEQHRSR
jgi:membrane-bound serine protease (ClpP class)